MLRESAKRQTRGALRLLGAVVLVSAFVCACAPQEQAAPPGPEEIELALEEFRQGEAPAAIARLERLLEFYPEGRLGDRAALVLGKLLMDWEKHARALEPLTRAAEGSVAPQYAQLLRVRAIVGGGLSDRYPEAVAQARSLVEGDRELIRPLVREEASRLLVELYSLLEEWEQAGAAGTAFLDQWPESGQLDRMRWLTAEALRRASRTGPAAELYATIWYDTPGSSWALEAREHLSALEKAAGKPVRRLSSEEQYEFIQALRRYGLHENALEEMGRLFSRFPRHPKTDGALFMKAMSLHDLRRNAESVAAVEELKRRFRGSQWLPAAGIYAIKAFRRDDRTPQVRKWADWIVDNYPGQPKAFEALYNLGSYLGNVESEQEGLRVLERLIAEGGSHDNVTDALWKAAWIYRRSGNTARAVATLERLLEEHPKTGYRKAALYWTARFSQDQGDTGRAVDFFQRCVEEFPHDYYGHQSAENLLAMGQKPRQVGSREAFPRLASLEELGARGSVEVRTAAYLESIGLYGFAAAELASARELTDDPALQFALAGLYSRSGDPATAIEIVNRHFKSFVVSGSRDPDLVPREFWYVVYPYNYRAAIRKGIREAGLEGAGIDPYLTAALIRMESRFLPTAISSVGASGLMQLMLYTAEEIAEERDLRPPTRSELFDPSTNIRYGTFYLAKLVRQFQGDWFPAICSYNAGAGAVRKWWNQRPPGQANDEFIENIPYQATRLYIKQVLGDYQNYQWLYRQDLEGERSAR